VLSTPIGDCRCLLISGTGLSQEPSRSATLFAAEQARAAGAEVVLDIDFRPDQWHDARAFGVTIRAALRLVDIVIGTEDEINAAMLTDPGQVSVSQSQVSDARVSGDIDAAIAALLALGPRALLQKRGEHGARVHLGPAAGCGQPALDVPGPRPHSVGRRSGNRLVTAMRPAPRRACPCSGPDAPHLARS